MIKSYADQCIERAEKATPGPYEVERVGFSNGQFAYEIQDENQLVAFYESNFKSPMKAKFNAELYANAPMDIQELARRLKKACEALRDPRLAGFGLDFVADELERPLEGV